MEARRELPPRQLAPGCLPTRDSVSRYRLPLTASAGVSQLASFHNVSSQGATQHIELHHILVVYHRECAKTTDNWPSKARLVQEKKGEGYRGIKDGTQKGLLCQKWVGSTLHTSKDPPLKPVKVPLDGTSLPSSMSTAPHNLVSLANLSMLPTNMLNSTGSNTNP
ncbi:unnamed protein product [Bubo scandiacus]